MVSSIAASKIFAQLAFRLFSNAPCCGLCPHRREQLDTDLEVRRGNHGRSVATNKDFTSRDLPAGFLTGDLSLLSANKNR